jgi:UDP-2,3-diacylglucosamine hydrolase
VLISTHLFVSDVHLCAERPAQRTRFLEFLDHTARSADSLYILGDLFEYWVGDDDLGDPFNAEIAAHLRALTERGVPVSFLHGNRDFLIGEAFARATGVTLLPDPVVVTLDGEATLLMHGDLLCSEDHDYLAFRQTVRDSRWQAQFLAQALPVRHQIAKNATQESESAKSGKAMAIMDATPSAVTDMFQAHEVKTLIHGHTHRPGIHQYPLLNATRYVLPEWYGRGGYLALENGVFREVFY